MLGVSVPKGRAFYGQSEAGAVRALARWLVEQGIEPGPVTLQRFGY